MLKKTWKITSSLYLPVELQNKKLLSISGNTCFSSMQWKMMPFALKTRFIGADKDAENATELIADLARLGRELSFFFIFFNDCYF